MDTKLTSEEFVKTTQEENDAIQLNNKQIADTINLQQTTAFQEHIESTPKEETNIPLPVKFDQKEISKLIQPESSSPAKQKELRISDLTKVICSEKEHLDEIEKSLTKHDVEPENKEDLTDLIKAPEFDEEEPKEAQNEPEEGKGIEAIFALADEMKKEQTENKQETEKTENIEENTKPVTSVKEEVHENVGLADEKGMAPPTVAQVENPTQISPIKAPEEPLSAPSRDSNPEKKAEDEISPVQPVKSEDVDKQLDSNENFGSDRLPDSPNPALSSEEQPGSRHSLKGTRAGPKKISKEEEKSKENKEMIKMLEIMMNSSGQISSNEQVEDMILELNKLTQHTNGNVIFQ